MEDHRASSSMKQLSECASRARKVLCDCESLPPLEDTMHLDDPELSCMKFESYFKHPIGYDRCFGNWLVEVRADVNTCL